MHLFILSSMVCLAVPYFSRCLINDTTFGKKLLNIKCIFLFFLQLLSETFLILRRIDRDVNVLKSPCKVPVILVRLYWNLNFLDGFSKNCPISNFMKIRPVGAELLHADRWTGRQTDTNVQTLRS
jgi:hypothetical protein